MINSINLDNSNVFYRCVEDSNEAIMLTDTKGILVYVNKAWQKIYGYSYKEAIGQTPRLLRSPDNQDQNFYKGIWESILDPKKTFWKGELINQSKDGEEIPILLTITPFRNNEGAIEGYMGIALDMREKKLMEAQIIQQDRLASIGLLASGLAHEIGTPLSVIRGRAEYLEILAGDSKKLKDGLQIIITQIDRISKLIYALLHMARADKTETARAVLLKEAISEVIQLTEQKLTRISTKFIYSCPDDVCIIADKDRLIQVFLNLVMNSIHAIESAQKNGKAGPHIVEIGAKLDKKIWIISIRDTGCGISNANMGHLFKPFFTTKEVGTGTGLGLAITHQIIQSWSGQISVESKENEGTVFTIKLAQAF